MMIIDKTYLAEGLLLGSEITKYGICTINANVINMLSTILALYTVHITDLCNGYRTAIKRSDVNTTTSHTLIKLHIYI